MKKLKNLYIGLKKDHRGQVEYLKGFIVEDGTTKKHLANKIKVDNWRDKSIEPLLVENLPLDGYEIVEVLSIRGYQGNTKCRIQVKHPLGFEFWLSPKSIENLLLKSKIDNGKIIDKMVMVMDGEVSIVPEFTEEIVNPPKPKTIDYLKQSQIIQGKLYKDKYHHYVYLGKHTIINTLNLDKQISHVYARMFTPYAYRNVFEWQSYEYLLTTSHKKFISQYVTENLIDVTKEIQRFQDKSNFSIIGKDDSYVGITKDYQDKGLLVKYNDYYGLVNGDKTVLFTLDEKTLTCKLIGTLNFAHQYIPKFDLYSTFASGKMIKLTCSWFQSKKVI